METRPLTPQSDAQRLTSLVKLKMVTDELLQDCLSSYSESSHGGHDQSSPTSPRDSTNPSMHPSDLTHIDSILTQDEALEVKAMARLRKRPTLRSRMEKEHFQFASEDGGERVGMLRVETHQHSDCKHMPGRM